MDKNSSRTLIFNKRWGLYVNIKAIKMIIGVKIVIQIVIPSDIPIFLINKNRLIIKSRVPILFAKVLNFLFIFLLNTSL